jgi:hypothetical protein
MAVMNNEDPALPEVPEDEAWYDAEIATALAALAKRCHERSMSFVACVEYQPGDRGGTYYLTEDAGLQMHMLHLAARTAPNVDRYILALRKHCKEHGQDISGSLVLRGIGA